MKRELTCIVCPMGCQIEIETEGDQVLSVKGNTCKRGIEYAKTECFDPRRTLTTTVKTEAGTLLSVKTDRPVPKDMIFDCMEAINRLHPAKESYAVGDVICPDLLGTGANLVATAAKNRM